MADFPDSSGVINLTTATFDDLVGVNENELWIVEFYAPWCGHCKALKPEYIEAAKQLKGLVKVGAVDADAAHNKEIAGRFGIRGFPTLKVFVGTDPVEDYNGARTASGIANYLLGKLPGKVKTLKSVKALKKWKAADAKPKVVLFTSKPNTPGVFKALSGSLGDYASFAVTKEPKVGKAFGIKLKDNVVGLFKPDELEDKDQEPVEYEKGLTAKGVTKFLRYWIPEIPEGDVEKLPQIADQSCWLANCVDKGLCVLLINSDNKDDNTVGHDVLIDVKAEGERMDFFAFSQIDGVANRDWVKAGFGERLVEQLDYGITQMVIVSPGKKRYAAYVGSKSFATTKDWILGIMTKKTATTPLEGDFPELDTSGEKCKRKPKKPEPKPRAADAEPQYNENPPTGGNYGKGHSNIPVYKGKKNLNTQTPGEGSKYIVHPNPSNFKDLVLNSNQPAIVEMYAPWCGHCKSLAGPYAKAAENVKGMVLFVGIDCSDQSNTAICQPYGVRGFPTIKLFPVGQKDNPIDYNGARTAGALAKAALGMLTGKVEKVTSDNFADFIAGDGKKFLLFTDKGKTPKSVRAIKTLYPNLKVGIVKNDEEDLCKKFGVDDFPTLSLISGSADAPESEELVNDKPKFEDMAEWIKNQLGDQVAGGGGGDDEDDAGSSNVEEIKDQAAFDAEAAKGGLLGVAFLNEEGIAAAREGKSEYVKTLQAIQNANPDAPYHFAFLDRAAYAGFATAFEVPDDEFGLVLMNVRKKRYARYVRSFSQSNVEDFVSNILKGKERTSKIPKIPPLAAEVEEKEEL